MGRKINAVARPFAYGATGILAKKAYDGYRAFVDGGLTETVGNALDKTEIINTVDGLHEVAGNAAMKVNEVPFLGQLSETLADYVPNTGEELATAVLLSIGGCYLIREGPKFAREPIQYMKDVKDYLENLGERTKAAFGKTHGVNARPWEFTKKVISATWDKIKYAPFYIPAIPLTSRGSDLIEPVGESAGHAFSTMMNDLYSWAASGASSPEWYDTITNVGSNASEFLVDYALPTWITIKVGQSLIRGYDRVIDEAKDVFRHRRT